MVSNDIINRFEKDGAVCIRGAVKNDDIKNLANKYLNMENYVKVVLYPENKALLLLR